MEDWILNAAPPTFTDLFPDHLDDALLERGQALYEAECASCHGKNGRDFTGAHVGKVTPIAEIGRSEEHTSEPQSLMRLSYAVFCLQKTTQTNSPALT